MSPKKPPRLFPTTLALIVAYDEAEAAIERVKALHVMEHARGHQWCLQDQRTWPCPTIVALKEPS